MKLSVIGVVMGVSRPVGWALSRGPRARGILVATLGRVVPVGQMGLSPVSGLG
jgi:hypothetical protein